MADKIITFTSESPCACCGGTAPSNCDCVNKVPNDLGFSPWLYPDFASVQASLAAFVASCAAWAWELPEDGLPAPTTFTADVSTPDALDLAITYAGGIVEILIVVGIAVEEHTSLTVVFTAARDGIEVISCSGQVRNCSDEALVKSASADGSSGTFHLNNIPAGQYFLELIAFASGEPMTSATFSVTADHTMLVLPVVGKWDDSGTTREVEACPRLQLPPLVEISDTWYADQTAAQAALDDEVSNCVGYAADPASYVSFAATDGGSSLTLAGVTGASQPEFAAWGSINAADGATLSIAFTVAASAGTPSGQASIYDRLGGLVETLSGASPLVSSALAYPGRYIIKVMAASNNPAAALTTASFVITSSGAMTVNPVQALYDAGLICPARLECTP